MTCVSCIIVGDGPLADEINARIQYVAPFRVPRFQHIYAKYQHDEKSLTEDEAQFVLRCAADIIDNQH